MKSRFALFCIGASLYTCMTINYFLREEVEVFQKYEGLCLSIFFKRLPSLALLVSHALSNETVNLHFELLKKLGYKS